MPLHCLRRKDYYDVLQLPKGASDSQLKRSYRKLALQYHPVRASRQSQRSYMVSCPCLKLLARPLSHVSAAS